MKQPRVLTRVSMSDARRPDEMPFLRAVFALLGHHEGRDSAGAVTAGTKGPVSIGAGQLQRGHRRPRGCSRGPGTVPTSLLSSLANICFTSCSWFGNSVLACDVETSTVVGNLCVFARHLPVPRVPSVVVGNLCVFAQHLPMAQVPS